MDKLKMHSPDMSQQNIDKIRALFPNCVTESRTPDGNLRLAVDFDLLKQELSDSIVEGPQERYHLNWPGKRQALLTANAPIAKTLRPCREDSVNFDTTQNLFIEGDNLDALKLLQETYLGKVKMIYIDPPYNTGNDFVYNDDFSERTDDFLIKSNQKNSHGEFLIANTEASGRFHSDWLSMIYPRLKVAKNMLHDQGLVFISIDDNEASNLIAVCNEIFGSKNFIGSLSWLKKRKGSFLSKKIVSVTEWVLIYGKSEEVKLFGGKADSSESQPLIKRTNPTSTLSFKGGIVNTKLGDGIYTSGVYGNGSSSVELLNDIKIKNGIIESNFSLKGPFIWSQAYLDSQVYHGAKIVINTDSFQVRAFKAEDEDSHKGLLSFINGVNINATNEDGYEQLRDLLNQEGVMSYPKPINLIKYLLKAQSWWDKDSLVLDFFAGSSTTAHAVMNLNAEDGGNRRFIMVQLPEATDIKSKAYKADYRTIAEISKERIRRAGKKVLEGECHKDWNQDIGFRVLKVDTSNMADIYYSPDAIGQGNLGLLVDNIKPDRSEEDLLFQVLLDWGIDLTLPISKDSLCGKTVYNVDDGALVACFDRNITEDLLKALAEQAPLRVVFRDDGFATDSLKINAEQMFKQLAPGTDVRAI